MSIADFFITIFKGVFILPRELGHITVYALCVVSILIITESILVLMFNILSKTKYYYVYSISIVILNAVLLLVLRKLDASVAKTELLISVLMITVMSVITVIVVKRNSVSKFNKKSLICIVFVVLFLVIMIEI